MNLKQNRIKITPLLVCACLLYTAAGAQSWQTIHKKAIVVDTHNDIISVCLQKGYSFDENLDGKTQSDLSRMKQGGLDGQVFSIFCGGEQKDPFQFANREIDTLYAWVKRNPKSMQLVTNPQQLAVAIKKHKLASMMGVEGGHMIENDLQKLDYLYGRGVRYMTLTWNNNNDWATSAEYESGHQKNNKDSVRKNGLTDFGKSVVRRMNQLGMMVDLSHVGEQTFWDAIAITDKPVLVSHSDCYALCPVYRNLKDDQIRAVGKNGGVIQLNFYPLFLDSTAEQKQHTFLQKHKAEKDSLKNSGMSNDEIESTIKTKYKQEMEDMQSPLSLLFDHIQHVIDLAGIDHVGLGGDFDGIGFTPKELTDVTKYPLITKELVSRGFSKKDIYKIMGGNFIRVFKANQKHDNQ